MKWQQRFNQRVRQPGQKRIGEHWPNWLRRLWWVLVMKTWPWKIPANVVKWVAIDQWMTEAEIRHGQALAKKYGWLTKDVPSDR